ncbi:MAG: class II aldolase/adducin family protein [Alphaproteobacteria bacterium]|jgi:ribulose-5-phosphate 4-epimerase/fuculose-1-phosphate aldolase|nr:class II aldolase/adducin family protein [Alphaproteobacteria bacterium]
MSEISETGKRAMDAGMDPVEWDLRVQLACAFRINAHLGWEDSINTHTSMRVPGPEHHFLINPFGLRFDEIKASDLVKVDHEGRVIGGETANPLNEAGFVIHSAIHMRREDAHCVLHTHTLSGMAVAAMADGLLPIGMFALGFHDRLSYHEFEGASGKHNITEQDRLAESLGPENKAMVMRAHGLLTVGRTVPEAFFWMYRLNRACEVQVLTHGAAGTYVNPSQEAREYTVKGTLDYATAYGTQGPGEEEFAAFTRLMDQKDPSFRH